MKKLKNSLYLVVLIAAALIVVSCSGDKKPSENKEARPLGKNVEKEALPVNYEDFETGKIMTLICKNDPSQSYTLYLPEAYTKDKEWPVIYLFDAHARGKMAAEVYVKSAERYGYIIIASNNFKNGTPNDIILSIAQKMSSDSQNRIAIDKKRIYTSGFSGGARAAVFVAQNISQVNGVIACGAGFPSKVQALPTGFFFIGVAGNQDFNLLELIALNKSFINTGFFNQLIVFDGKHDWPPAKVADDAVLWLEVQAMKNNLTAVNDSLIDACIADFERRIIRAEKNKNYLRQYDYQEKLMGYLDGLRDINEYKIKIGEIASNPEYQKMVNSQNTIFIEENEAQKKYAKSIVSVKYDKDWWKKEIESIRDRIKKSKDKNKTDADERLLAYLSLMSYTHADNALGSGQMNHAGRFLDVYYFADPDNPDCSFLWACFHALKGNTESALGVLEVAVRLGFSNLELLEGDPRLQSIRGEEKYKEIIAKLKDQQN